MAPDLNARDNYGQTPLHCAILGKQLKVVQFLLSNKVKVKTTADKGDTPLHCAVRVGSIDLVQVGLNSSRLALQQVFPIQILLIFNMPLNLIFL